MSSTAVQESQVNAAERRAKGEFVRGVSGCRNFISADEGAEFPPEPNRYHLFIAYNCPWCHRAALARALHGLEDSISVDVCFPNRTLDDDPAGAGLWEFNPTRVASLTGAPLPECTSERATGKGFRLVKEIYEFCGVTDEKSVPILFDKKTKEIVNNESAEIIRMLSQHSVALGGKRAKPEMYPIDDNPGSAELRKAIDELNEITYVGINNGAYKAGFSSDQAVYAQAFQTYFAVLDTLEEKLKDDERPFLLGFQMTEADLRLFPTLYRHDPVYYVRMKLNGARILDYPYLWRWLCRMYQAEGVAESSPLVHCRQGYFGRSWNNVVPLGPMKPMPYPEAYFHPELSPLPNRTTATAPSSGAPGKL